jgi:hypothetical protein
MNNAKRNRLKNKEKIKKLKQQIKNSIVEKEPLVIYEVDETLQKECALLKAEIRGLYRFLSRVNIDFQPLVHSFNVPYPQLVSQLSDGSLTPQKLDTIRMNKYATGRYTYGTPEPLYMIGLVPEGNPSLEIQASFFLSPDLIRDVPIDYLIEKHLREILKTRKNELLMKE